MPPPWGPSNDFLRSPCRARSGGERERPATEQQRPRGRAVSSASISSNSKVANLLDVATGSGATSCVSWVDSVVHLFSSPFLLEAEPVLEGTTIGAGGFSAHVSFRNSPPRSATVPSEIDESSPFSTTSRQFQLAVGFAVSATARAGAVGGSLLFSRPCCGDASVRPIAVPARAVGEE